MTASTTGTVTRTELEAALNKIESDPEKLLQLANHYLEANPEASEGLKAKGLALAELENFAAAVDALARALQALPNDPQLLQTLAYSHLRCHQFEKAIEYCETLLSQDEKRTEAWYILGVAQDRKGEPERALGSLERALELAPDNAAYHYAAAHLKRFCTGDPTVEQLKRLLGSTSSTVEDKIYAAFTLGKAHWDMGERETAFFYYQMANEHKKPLVDQRTSGQSALRSIHQLYDKPLFDRIAPLASAYRPHIMIAGISRSGKSLVEKILADHPQVIAGEEDPRFHHYAYHRVNQAGGIPPYLAQLDAAKLRQDSGRYLDLIGFHGWPAGQLLTNTMPENLWILALAGLWFPETPIVFCMRNLLDLGLAGYFTNYQSGYAYSYDLHTLGEYIAAAEAAMIHWANILPNPIYIVEYSDLTNDPQKVADQLYEGMSLLPHRLSPSFFNDAGISATLGPADSVEGPCAFRCDFNNIGEDFIDQLAPLIEGYRSVAQRLGLA